MSNELPPPQFLNKMEIKGLRRAVQDAYKLYNKASIAIQKIETYMIYSGFRDGNEPDVSMCTGGELILVYQGQEMFVEDAIRIMEEVGYITPDDFE